jgi:hypothetical protein
VPTFALVTPGGTALGAFELDDDEAQDGAIIRRDGEPDRRLVARSRATSRTVRLLAAAELFVGC